MRGVLGRTRGTARTEKHNLARTTARRAHRVAGDPERAIGILFSLLAIVVFGAVLLGAFYVLAVLARAILGAL